MFTTMVSACRRAARISCFLCRWQRHISLSDTWLPFITAQTEKKSSNTEAYMKYGARLNSFFLLLAEMYIINIITMPAVLRLLF